jgi:hypothetical protein
MRRYRGGRVIVVAVVGLFAAAVAGTFIERGSGSASLRAACGCSCS